MPSRVQAHVLLFFVNLLYAANYTIARFAMPEHITPESFVVVRAAVGTLTFLIIHTLWVREKIDVADWYKLIACGLFGVAVNQLMFFKGLSLTQPINASLIMIMVPIMVIIIAAVALRERIGLLKVAGVMSGLAGAAMIIVSGRHWTELRVNTGDFFILINATSYAVYLVLVKSLMLKYQPFTVMRWVFFFGFFMVLPFGMAGLGEVDWANLPRLAWFAIVYVLVGVTILTYLLNAVALKTASASLVSTYIYLQPLLAAVIATALGRDTLTTPKMMAGLLIFLGVYLVSFRPAGISK